MPRVPELFPKTVYCIDTSSLINLKPFRRDVFPTIWSKVDSHGQARGTYCYRLRLIVLFGIHPRVNPWNSAKGLESMIKNGGLIAPLEVYGEIEIGKDKIYDWCKNNKEMFKDVDECQIQELQEIKKRYDKKYWENEINKPKWADPWVIALSICEEATIVADEKDTQNRIPAISSMFGLKCLELIDFFKEIGIKY